MTDGPDDAPQKKEDPLANVRARVNEAAKRSVAGAGKSARPVPPKRIKNPVDDTIRRLHEQSRKQNAQLDKIMAQERQATAERERLKAQAHREKVEREIEQLTHLQDLAESQRQSQIDAREARDEARASNDHNTRVQHTILAITSIGTAFTICSLLVVMASAVFDANLTTMICLLVGSVLAVAAVAFGTFRWWKQGTSNPE